MRKVILGVLTLALMGSLYGCNTIKGIGDDVKTVGGWISSGSEHVEESIKKNPPGSGN
ncbi:MAG TPA: entericidin EcnA/B family protein [Candidatus Omnitrophota bacterium]|nr:entericidin EcnA/B family protein [Candidatus Omnitrophota bacterium]